MLLAHCDWSISAAKRWICAAITHASRVCITTPTPVGPLDALIPRLRALAPTGPILLGVDFPIGLPRSYAQKAGITYFPGALLNLNAEFFTPALTAAEISLNRPFYPGKPGGTSKRQLVEGLGLNSPSELLRLCDHATRARAAACEIFWTLGAKQVGRSAISGWQDLLIPLLRENRIKLWPFDGELSDLLNTENIVVAESYPAETYVHLGLARGFGKTTQTGRKSQARQLLEWCHLNDISLDSHLRARIVDGFGSISNGDDPFDSFVGLLGLIEVVRDPLHFPALSDPLVREIEGWILGM